MSERCSVPEEKPLPSSRIGALALKTFRGREYHKRERADRQRAFEAQHVAEIRQQLAGQTEIISRITQLLGPKPKENPGQYDWSNLEENFDRKRVRADLADGSMVRVLWKADRTRPTIGVELMNPSRAQLEKKHTEGLELPLGWNKTERTSDTYLFKFRSQDNPITGMEGALRDDGYLVSYTSSTDKAKNTKPDSYHALGMTPTRAPLGLLRDNWENLAASAGIDPVYTGPTQEDILQLSTKDLRQAQQDALIPVGSQSRVIRF